MGQRAPLTDVISIAVSLAVKRAMEGVDPAAPPQLRPAPADRLEPPPMPRRRGRDDAGEDENVDLGAPEHEWWAASPIDPFARPDPEPEPEPPPATSTGEVVPDDPYAVLRVLPSADWETIVAAYRKLARWYHPDGLTDPAPADREACEDMIRRLNAAYAELRVRRGR